MHTTDRRVNFSLKYCLIDMLTLTISFTLAYLVNPTHISGDRRGWYTLLLVSFNIVFFLLMMFFRMYNKSTLFFADRVAVNTTLSLFGATVMIFMFLFMAYNTIFSRLFLFIFISISFILLNAQKLITLKIKSLSMSKIKIIYVGEVRLYDDFIRYSQTSAFDFNILGYVSIDDETVDGLACLGRLEEFEDILRNNPCDHVIFTQSLSERQEIGHYLNMVSEMGIVSRVILDVYRLDTTKWYTGNLGGFPMLTYYNNMTLDPIALAVKRIIDIVGACVGILLALPIMAITAIAIKIESSGPVIFKQVRVGQNGRRFSIYKFRSMYKDAESRLADLMDKNEMGSDGKIFKMKNDPRITKVGKFIRKTSIDELPQFFNVLIGNMSLVGTRPPTINEVERYERQHYRRISIKPGITGIWQTSGRNEIQDFEKIVKMDVEYIEKWSILLDVVLILKTLKVLVKKNGAY